MNIKLNITIAFGLLALVVNAQHHYNLNQLYDMREGAISAVPEASVGIMKYNFDNQAINSAPTNASYHNKKIRNRNGFVPLIVSAAFIFTGSLVKKKPM